MATRAAARLSPGEGRRFALTLATAFIGLAALLLWRGATRIAAVCGLLGATLALAGLVLPTRLGPVQRAWMGVAHAISKVTTPLFMGLVYYLVLTPTGLLRRGLGSNPLRRARSGQSSWVSRRESPRSDLTRQF